MHNMAFVQMHNTNTALCDCLNFLIIAFDSKLYAIGIFIDVAKAFDSVDHSLLLCKLKHYGIREVALSWFNNFNSYLSDRF